MEIAAIVAVLVVLIGVPVVVVNRDLLLNRSAAKRAQMEAPLPFLIIPSYLGAADLVPTGVSRQPASRPVDDSLAAVLAPSRPSTHPDPAPTSVSALHVPAAPPFTGAPPEHRRWTPPDEARAGSNGFDRPLDFADVDEEDVVASDATVIFNRPVDEPMQILPGRLQIISGEPATEDLRLFSRLGEPARIHVGRDTGPAHQYITLHSPTVSRRHARMDFENGTWTITNLSQTNPVLVNDRVLTNGGSARKLCNGDRIELGEVALRFLTS